MNKFWKWFLGILLGLVVLAILVGVGMAFRMHNVLGDVRGFAYDDGFRGYGMMPFGGMLFGGLLRLGFLVLVVLGIVWLVRKFTKPATTPAPVALAVVEAPKAVCGKCSYPVESGWKVCPNCGKKL
jgi:hypothetical protein